ncbi:MAG: hypothetical protein JRJ02_05780 [Deltaproteobacteria bacterium]|nr:hypothetical protein [Deltaproteobacteria bacterium]MBW1861867.1 hypothetical protein [Deltaproteobacteria bacterium]
MRYRILPVFLLFFLLFAGTAKADLTGTGKIQEHIHKKLESLEIQAMSEDEKRDLLVNTLRLNLNMVIPVYGSYILDNTLYGNVRPPAIIFDWSLGGFIPLVLLLTVVMGKDKISRKRKEAMIYTAVGLYIITRIGVIITINDHIRHYNEYIKIQVSKGGIAENGRYER